MGFSFQKKSQYSRHYIYQTVTGTDNPPSFDMGQTGLLEGATHYHSIRVFPEWRKTKTRIVKIEDHIFYRWEE